MRTTLVKTLLASLLLFAPRLVSADEAMDVLKCFETYKTAILEQKGETAVSMVTKGTIDEYQHYVDWALKADRKTLESLTFINRMQTFLLKQRIPVDTLKKLDGRSVFAYAVDKDWIGKTAVVKTTLGKIEAAGGKASAEVMLGEQKSPLKYQFVQENGAWKLDLLQVMKDTNAVFKELAKRQGVTEDEFMFTLIERVSGKKVEDSIWVPLQK